MSSWSKKVIAGVVLLVACLVVKKLWLPNGIMGLFQ